MAVSECGDYPNIYIYKIPEMKLYRILSKGAERAFSCLSFNDKGHYLASVGSDPDYFLIVWNWINETIILKAKAFSQEIFRVRFSSNFEGKIITSGMGHIKFWEMANTFTGLKLQGELGKFGQIDLSDVSAFFECSDGKVISGTEYGTLLLWEGIFIKSQIFRRSGIEGEEVKLHDGFIEYINLDNGMLMTAAHDGYIKWWNYSEIYEPKVDDRNRTFIEPIKQVAVANENGRMAKIININKINDDFWAVTDGHGSVLKLDIRNNFAVSSIYDFNVGPVRNLSVLKDSPFLFSITSDGKACLQNIKEQQQNQKIDLNQDLSTIEKCTSACFLERQLSSEPFFVAYGLETGVFRIESLDPKDKKLRKINFFKAHEEPIKFIKFSNDGYYLITGTETEIFFFLIENMAKITPICFIKNKKEITDIDWHPSSKMILFGDTTGSLREVKVPIKFDSTNTFFHEDYECVETKVKLSYKQAGEGDKNKRKRKTRKTRDPEPTAVVSCKYFEFEKEGDFVFTAADAYQDSLYVCNMEDERPKEAFSKPKKPFEIVKASKNYVFLASPDGSLHVRSKSNLVSYVELFPCAVNYSNLISAYISPDEKLVYFGLSNGTCIGYTFNGALFEKLTLEALERRRKAEEEDRMDLVPDYSGNEELLEEIVLPKLEEKVIENIQAFDKEVQVLDETEVKLSLEETRKEDEKRKKLEAAEKKKEENRKKIEAIKQEYEKLLLKNSNLDIDFRMEEKDLVIDEDYFKEMIEINDDKIEELFKKYDWLKEHENVVINKVNELYISSEEQSKLTVFSIHDKNFVSTIRCAALEKNFMSMLEKINQEIEEERKVIDLEMIEEQYKEIMKDAGDSDEIQTRIGKMIESVNERIKNYSKDNTAKRADELQAEIRVEYEDSLKEKVKISELNRHFNAKVHDKHHHDDKKSHVDTKIKCPERENLKINADLRFDERNMKTVVRHKKIILEFVYETYSARVKFNKEVLRLRNRKQDLIETLKSNKSQLIEINRKLKKEEDLSWLDAKDRKDLEFPEHLDEVTEVELKTFLETKRNDQLAEEILRSKKEKVNENKESTEEDLIKYKDRSNKKYNHTEMEKELNLIEEMQLEYQRETLINDSRALIEDFDESVRLKLKERCDLHLKQKLSELEIAIKHEELVILKAHKVDDEERIMNLRNLFMEYENNLHNFRENMKKVEEIKHSLSESQAKRREYEEEFEQVTAQEKETKETLKQLFYMKTKAKNANKGQFLPNQGRFTG